VAGNFLRFPIFFDLDFLFGSIFALLALQCFGLRRGVVAAILSSAYTILHWNHPYACLILTAEVAVVGWLFPRHKIGLVLADVLYWLCLGMPLVYLFYHGVMHVSWENTGIIMIKQAVNGIATLSVRDFDALLRNAADKQVLLRVAPAAAGTARDVVVTPVSLARETSMRYDEWEYTRRLAVEKAGQSKLGYVHLRAMQASDMSQWQREFYPIFDRDGLIIDVRHNNGGNIDSWILEKLLRKAWFYWQPRIGSPTWNMQYAFRGHVVVIADQNTASDGEAFAEGFRRLGLGKVIGTRTWGGEVWLSSSNFLVDRGIATAAETGVFGPDGDWLIEGHGVDPDIVVDNLPHATFTGEDAQLDAAIKYLQEEIRKKPILPPVAPKYPDKSLKPRTTRGSQPGAVARD
jgi:C-terminal processing protease CtpA/Prc